MVLRTAWYCASIGSALRGPRLRGEPGAQADGGGGGRRGAGNTGGLTADSLQLMARARRYGE